MRFYPEKRYGAWVKVTAEDLKDPDIQEIAAQKLHRNAEKTFDCFGDENKDRLNDILIFHKPASHRTRGIAVSAWIYDPREITDEGKINAFYEEIVAWMNPMDGIR